MVSTHVGTDTVEIENTEKRTTPPLTTPPFDHTLCMCVCARTCVHVCIFVLRFSQLLTMCHCAAAGQEEQDARRAEAQSSAAQGDYLHGMDLPSMTSSEDEDEGEEEASDEDAGEGDVVRAPSDDVGAVASLLEGCLHGVDVPDDND